MQAIFDFLVGIIAALAATALGHLGVDLERRAASEPQEIHRTTDCAPPSDDTNTHDAC